MLLHSLPLLVLRADLCSGITNNCCAELPTLLLVMPVPSTHPQTLNNGVGVFFFEIPTIVGVVHRSVFQLHEQLLTELPPLLLVMPAHNAHPRTHNNGSKTKSVNRCVNQ